VSRSSIARHNVLVLGGAIALAGAVGVVMAKGTTQIQIVAILGCIALVAIGVAALRGLSLVEIYCVTLIWVSPFSALLRDVSIGPVSAFGVWTVLATGVGGILWLMAPKRRRIPGLAPIVGFAALCVVWLLVFPLTLSGLQAVIAVVGFAVVMMVAASADDGDKVAKSVSTAFAGVAWITVALYVLTIVVAGIGSAAVYGPRGFALFALVPLAWTFARWRYDDRTAVVPTIGLLVGTILSLSRLATGIGFFLWPLSRIDSRARVRDWVRLFVLVAFAACVFLVAIDLIPPLHERFAEGDLVSFGGIAINVSGRDNVWSVVWQSALRSPWIGQGPGSSDLALLGQGFKVSQPHNEYLRVFHDFGIIGLAVWLYVFMVLLRRTYEAWVLTDQRDGGMAVVHLAAWLGLVTLALGMVTDNSLRYVHILLPLGVTVGCSLRLSASAPAPPTNRPTSPTIGGSTALDARDNGHGRHAVSPRTRA
jgi:O-antigen ligase